MHSICAPVSCATCPSKMSAAPARVCADGAGSGSAAAGSGSGIGEEARGELSLSVCLSVRPLRGESAALGELRLPGPRPPSTSSLSLPLRGVPPLPSRSPLESAGGEEPGERGEPLRLRPPRGDVSAGSSVKSPSSPPAAPRLARRSRALGGLAPLKEEPNSGPRSPKGSSIPGSGSGQPPGATVASHLASTYTQGSAIVSRTPSSSRDYPGSRRCCSSTGVLLGHHSNHRSMVIRSPLTIACAFGRLGQVLNSEEQLLSDARAGSFGGVGGGTALRSTPRFSHRAPEAHLPRRVCRLRNEQEDPAA